MLRRVPGHLALYGEAAGLRPDDAEIRIDLGRALQTLRRFEEARREYRFRDETERKLRRLQERLKYDFLHTHMPFVRAMAFFSNEFYKIVKQWNPKPFENMRVQETQLGLQKVTSRLLEFEEMVETDGVTRKRTANAGSNERNMVCLRGAQLGFRVQCSGFGFQVSEFRITDRKVS